MVKARIVGVALALAVSAAVMEPAVRAQLQPEMSGPVLLSKASLPAGDLSTAATTTGHAQLVALLRYASESMVHQKSPDASDWNDVARDQGIIKDLAGIKATAALMDKTLAAETDPENRATASDETWRTLAGAYAWGGDMDTAKSYAAKVDKDDDPEELGLMRAQMGDMAGVEKALAKMSEDDRQFAYGSIAEDLWIGDPAFGEQLLKKIKDPNGDPDDFIAVHYASAREIQKATKIAKTVEMPYYWEKIAEAYEEEPDYDGAKTAKAAFLKCVAGRKDAEQKSRMGVTFEYQMELEKPEVAAATEQKLVKYALAMMEVSGDDWQNTAAEAGCAAARLGDDAGVKAVVDAAAAMPNSHHQREYVAEGVKNGQSLKLLADGKEDEAIALAGTTTDIGQWHTWKTKEDLFRYAMEHKNIPLALKIEDAVGTTDMLHWVMRLLVKMQIEGTPLNGKPVDVFTFIAAEDSGYERGEAAQAVAEELLRRGAK